MQKRVMEKYRAMSPVVKAGLWFTICNFLQKGISFITIPIFTRIMSTEEYGLYSIYSSWYSILVIFATLHLSYYVFNKGLVKFEDDRENFVVSIQSLSAAITVAFIIVYYIFRKPINGFIGMPTSMIILMMVQILFEPPVLYWTARKRFEYKYQAVILVTIAISLLNPLIGILIIKLGVFENAALARVFSIALVSLVFGAVFGLTLARKGDHPFNTKYWRYALGFNLPLIPHYLSTTILSSADRIMIGDMVGNSEAGIYSVAYSIGMVCTLFSQAIQQAYLPWLYKRMKREEYSGIPEISNAFLILMLGILAMVTCFAPEVVWIVGSSKYMDAIWAIPPICGSIFFIFLQNLFANVEYYFEKTKLIAAASVGVALLNVILNYIFIKLSGYLAAGYTTLFCYIVYSLVHFVVMRRICRQNDLPINNLFDFKAVIGLSILMLGVIAIMLMVYNYIIIRYAIFLVIMVIAILNRKKIISMVRSIRSNG